MCIYRTYLCTSVQTMSIHFWTPVSTCTPSANPTAWLSTRKWWRLPWWPLSTCQHSYDGKHDKNKTFDIIAILYRRNTHVYNTHSNILYNIIRNPRVPFTFKFLKHRVLKNVLSVFSMLTDHNAKVHLTCNAKQLIYVRFFKILYYNTTVECCMSVLVG